MKEIDGVLQNAAGACRACEGHISVLGIEKVKQMSVDYA